MIRFRIGTSVFQFRRSAVVVGIVRATVLIGIFYVLYRIFYHNFPNKSKSLPRPESDKSEISVLERRLEKLEEELQRNRLMLGQVKDTVKDLIKAGPDSDLKKRLLNGPAAVVRLNRSYVSLSSSDCQFCTSSAAEADDAMIDVYDKIEFENADGGVWKQGWDLKYDESQWDSSNKLKIFVVPHSHNDPGWIKTFDKYYKDQTQHILNNMVTKMKDDKRRKFIWAEISYLSFWWDKLDQNSRLLVRRYVNDGQLEIVTGGWVMNDEATAHYFAMIEQMVEGHQWLEHNLEFKPKNGWAIDPFGLSSTMAYLLRRMGLDNMVIQRVHYSVKKYLAQKKSLEFLWRQSWDHNHTMDILCHTMPFYSYDVPHTCGPDPKVCCQFDFKRLPGNKVNCPWRVPPVPITDKNVADRAHTLLDQYRKKAQLFRSNVLMIQLGDDFRYDKATEWDQQFTNYQKLFDYINGREDWNTEAQFGTLEDYFTALRADNGFDARSMPTNFPSLSGDFFTYADRDDHYWSGYFTSRPFYKNMDRTLEAHLRGAEILFSLMWAKMGNNGASYLPFVEGLMKDLITARRALGLFQHHDAITGTSKDHVVIDYATRMFQSLQKLRNVIAQSAVYVLSPEYAEVMDPQVALLQMDEYRQHHSSLPIKIPVKFSSEVNIRHIFLYNSLSHSRKEIVTLRVASPSIEVKDSSGKIIPCQINPIFAKTALVTTEYELLFISELPAMGISRYSIHLVEDSEAISSRASVTFFNVESLPDAKDFVMRQYNPPDEFVIKSNYLTAVFSGTDGLLRQIISNEDKVNAGVRIQFLRYGTRTKGKDKSGAYLFLPDADAQEIKFSKPHIRVVEGPLMSEVTVFLPEIEHHIRLKNSPGLDGSGFDIYNLIDISKDLNKELIMRFSTNISNENHDFYTDLNGFQNTRRHVFEKLPIQANVYPVTTIAYFEDTRTRFSLLTGHSVGATSVAPGWLEVFLDRRLNQDDNRGLQQGVTDNKETPMNFRIILEHSKKPYTEASSTTPSYPSLLAHHASLSLLHPVFTLVKLESQLEPNINFHDSEFDLQPTFAPVGEELPCDIHMLNLRTLQAYPGGTASFLPSNSSALFLHRLGFDCHYKMWGVSCSTKNGTVSVGELFPEFFGPNVEEASLSLMYTGNKFSRDAHIQLPPMEIVTLKLNRRVHPEHYAARRDYQQFAQRCWMGHNQLQIEYLRSLYVAGLSS